LKRLLPVGLPMLFAAFPLLTLFADNQTEVELAVLWRPLLISLAAAALVYGLFLLIFKSATKAAILASLVMVVFFSYGTVWVALLALAALAVLVTKRNLSALALGLSVAAVVLVVGPTARIVNHERDHPLINASDPKLWPTALEKPVLPSGAPRPDIYVLIPDDYARSDVLKRYFHYDNSTFIHGLEQRGFQIAEQSRSPYSHSEMNVAAEVNMDYLSRLPAILGKKSQDYRPVRRLIESNRAARLLGSLGYRYVQIDTDEVTYAAGNPDISPVATPDSFMTQWLQQTVLGNVGGPIGFNEAARNERFRKTIRSRFSDLADVPRQPGPKFVLFHTLIPHDPYIFGPQGEASTFPDRSDEGHTRKSGMRYYVKQARFVETKMLEAVDAIQSQSKQPPVIVIEADEGFESNEADWGEAAVRDMRVKGIAALSLPGKPGLRPPEKLNTVNTLRFVFNNYLGTRYPLLRSASYPELDLPYQLEEIPVRGLATGAAKKRPRAPSANRFTSPF
jgi:hypothetical protein